MLTHGTFETSIIKTWNFKAKLLFVEPSVLTVYVHTSQRKSLASPYGFLYCFYIYFCFYSLYLRFCLVLFILVFIFSCILNCISTGQTLILFLNWLKFLSCDKHLLITIIIIGEISDIRFSLVLQWSKRRVYS